jgi:dimethylhistidine N-methyltransferase
MMTTARPLRRQAPPSPESAPLVTRADEHGEAPARSRELIDGLTAADAWISPKFLYDPLGSRLFEAITELPEYYPTRTEAALLERHIGSIAQAAGQGATIIELGAGNCSKAARLFKALRPAQYVAVDISAQFLESELSALARSHPDIEFIGVGADITAGIRLPESVKGGRRVFLYLGSSIGNFNPDDALAILRDIRAHCGASGGLLIGVDLVKSVQVLQDAYDDALGVTAAFNLNILNHMNALVGSNFNVRDWKHVARFSAAHSRMEMHLEARRDLLVAWPDGSRKFRAGERIHTENSYKYLLDDFNDLLKEAGFARVRGWTDEPGWFALCHAFA